MKRETAARRGAVFGALTSFTFGFVCLACVLPGIGAIIGISFLVTAVGGIADDGVLTVVGIIMLVVSIALGAYVLVAQRRYGQSCVTEGLKPGTGIELSAHPIVAETEAAPERQESARTSSRRVDLNQGDTERK